MMKGTCACVFKIFYCDFYSVNLRREEDLQLREKQLKVTSWELDFARCNKS